MDVTDLGFRVMSEAGAPLNLVERAPHRWEVFAPPESETSEVGDLLGAIEQVPSGYVVSFCEPGSPAFIFTTAIQCWQYFCELNVVNSMGT
ncbi:MAG: hypothetical protein JWQ43_1484 [Glaciihabitans sp.]|nr:hypothetical protein [Glaciihabitans sp.]